MRAPAITVFCICLASNVSGLRAEPGTTWPSFRGPHASGVLDGVDLPDEWDGEAGTNILWKTAIPGLAHSSPIVWGDQVFVTTAVSSERDATFKHGLYGDGTASSDRSVHRWKLYSLSLESGEVLWERIAHEGVPRDKRHIKATYANSTPATDGQVVVAFFGSEGLFAFDLEGNPLWQRDVGRLDTGAYNAPTYEWGPASSPILYDGKVILQCDTQGEDFLIALDSKSGETVWKTGRDELPSWGTPTVYTGSGRTELITNGSNLIAGYDPETGGELWRLAGSSKITAPTPIFADGLIVVASGRRPEKPIFVIRAGAEGDISLDEPETTNEFVVWHRLRHGPYMPTPIVYGGTLYVLNNDGIVGAYDLASGREYFRERLSHRGGGFSGSPVAGDGKLYFSGEDGEIFVVRAARELEVVAVNPVGERLMATPALAGDRMLIRGQHHLFAIGSAEPTAP